jgi:hypothetical protein
VHGGAGVRWPSGGAAAGGRVAAAGPGGGLPVREVFSFAGQKRNAVGPPVAGGPARARERSERCTKEKDQGRYCEAVFSLLTHFRQQNAHFAGFQDSTA